MTTQGCPDRILGQSVGVTDRDCAEKERHRHPAMHRLQDGECHHGNHGIRNVVDDFLTHLESYLWLCSLDEASGFWAIMMLLRVRKISGFVCALGHFEWL